jgi:hypothetical protein
MTSSETHRTLRKIWAELLIIEAQLLENTLPGRYKDSHKTSDANAGDWREDVSDHKFGRRFLHHAKRSNQKVRAGSMSDRLEEVAPSGRSRSRLRIPHFYPGIFTPLNFPIRSSSFSMSVAVW